MLPAAVYRPSDYIQCDSNLINLLCCHPASRNKHGFLGSLRNIPAISCKRTPDNRAHQIMLKTIFPIPTSKYARLCGTCAHTSAHAGSGRPTIPQRAEHHRSYARLARSPNHQNIANNAGSNMCRRAQKAQSPYFVTYTMLEVIRLKPAFDH